MDDRQFDIVARKLASGCSRRAALKALLGIGGITAAGLATHDRAEAARRGFSGPNFSFLFPPPPTCISDSDPCTVDPSECCSGYCCKPISDPGFGFCCTPPSP